LERLPLARAVRNPAGEPYGCAHNEASGKQGSISDVDRNRSASRLARPRKKTSSLSQIQLFGL
jgi:hypothetical protein